jgi:hypothetical protein
MVLRAGDEEHADRVAIQDTDVVLGVVDAKAEHVPVVRDSCRDVVQRQLRHDLLEHAIAPVAVTGYRIGVKAAAPSVSF